MAIQEMELDPNAASYTDDEIVGKVNAATTKVSADSTEDGTTNKVFTATDETKLGTVEDNAAADQTGAEIKTAYEGEANAFTDAKDTKLTGIDAGAEVNPADLAELDSTQDSKLNAIEANATVDQTGDEIVTAIDAGASSITREDAIDASAMDIVKTDPTGGEFKVKSIQRKSTGKLGAKYDDVAV